MLVLMPDQKHVVEKSSVATTIVLPVISLQVQLAPSSMMRNMCKSPSDCFILYGKSVFLTRLRRCIACFGWIIASMCDEREPFTHMSFV